MILTADPFAKQRRHRYFDFPQPQSLPQPFFLRVFLLIRKSAASSTAAKAAHVCQSFISEE